MFLYIFPAFTVIGIHACLKSLANDKKFFVQLVYYTPKLTLKDISMHRSSFLLCLMFDGVIILPINYFHIEDLYNIIVEK